MLRRFLYLDEPILTDYVSVLEDGLRDKRTSATGESSERSGNADLKVVGGALGSGTSEGETVESRDTAPARFARLLDLAKADPDLSGWLDVVTLDDLSGAGSGAIVDFECELHVPDISLLTDAEGLTQVANMMESFAGLAGLLGEDVSDLPKANEISGVKNLAQAMKSNDLIVVGEDEDADWRCAGSLRRDLLRTSTDELSDFFRVTGKVGRSIPEGQYKPLLGLPAMSLLPRAERRALERNKPSADDMDMYLAGPARMIDVLAIYR